MTISRQLCATLFVALALSFANPSQGTAQNFQGSTLSTFGGLVLGAYSGAGLGLLGTMMPCNRTPVGGRCTASGASAGTALALAMGGLIGAQNQDDLKDRFTNAGLGTLVGGVIGVGLRRGVRQYGWNDVIVSAAIGGAVGAAPTGAMYGAGAGLVVGGIAWLVVPKSGLPDLIMVTLAGVAVGGLVDWAQGAADANRRNDPIPGLSFSIPVGG